MFIMKLMQIFCHLLTHETTRPLKTGRLAESSMISSLTTLKHRREKYQKQFHYDWTIDLIVDQFKLTLTLNFGDWTIDLIMDQFKLTLTLNPDDWTIDLIIDQFKLTLTLNSDQMTLLEQV